MKRLSGFCKDFHEFFLEKSNSELNGEYFRQGGLKHLDWLKLKLLMFLGQKVNANQKVKFNNK